MPGGWHGSGDRVDSGQPCALRLPATSLLIIVERPLREVAVLGMLDRDRVRPGTAGDEPIHRVLGRCNEWPLRDLP